jgi:effector-binding domain-containing protein
MSSKRHDPFINENRIKSVYKELKNDLGSDESIDLNYDVRIISKCGLIYASYLEVFL